MAVVKPIILKTNGEKSEPSLSDEVSLGIMQLDTSAPIITPSINKLNISSKDLAGRAMLAQTGSSGLDTIMQPHFGRNKVGIVLPTGNTVTVTALGISLTAVGTATIANVGVTNIHTAMRRIEYAVTTASATAVSGWRDTAARYFIGGTYGGFTYVCRFGPSRGVAADATRRMFNGFTSVTTASTDVNPSTIANCVGVGCDSTDTNWYIMHRTGTGTVQKIDTGITKSVTDNTEVYELAMFSAPGVSKVTFRFERLSDNTVFTYNTTTNLPGTSTLLSPRMQCSVGGTSSVIGVSLISLYIETDY